jgi:sigma-B regulation protein RsbU (phosphoserine phosphatase)
MSALQTSSQALWRRLSRLDVVALILLLVGSVTAIAGPSGGIFGFLKFLGILAAIYVIVRVIGWSRSRLLWSLRNRLIVAYLFIAVVPILLVLTFVFFAGRLLYSQLGSYLLYEDLQQRVSMISDIAEHIAAAHETLPPSISQAESEKILAAQSHAVHDRELLGLTIEFSDDPALLHKLTEPSRRAFAGMLQQGESLSLVSLRSIPSPTGSRIVILRVPVTPEFLATVAPDLGAIQLNLMRQYSESKSANVIYSSGGVQYEAARRIVARNRALQAAGPLIDPAINVVSRLDAVYLNSGNVERSWPVLVVFSARPSKLNGRMLGSLGELREFYLVLFGTLAVVFFLIEIAALITGIVLTRRITSAIADLYEATQFVQAGDLTHRVRIDRRDQLGILGESFNLMTGSISGLIEEQKQRQRLENELAIASEVQNQLFPQKLPAIPGVEIQAICKAARTVSGDYYDFIQLGPTQLAIAIADISGKGISAALLMASLQAALRSQLLAPGSVALSTAELVARLNLHLVRNTAEDRFATFFIAVYDSSTRVLRYTNAGHLPSFLVSPDATAYLDKGGMVLGVVDEYAYEEGRVTVPPNSLLVAYSDGLVEPENVFGEEFGIRRLQDATVRVRNGAPLAVAESLMTAAEEWAGTPEQADDMTVVVARLQ